MDLNWQTKEKIENLKKSIKQKEGLKDIVKKFFSSKNRKDQWLEKYHSHFTEKELNYLEFEIVKKSEKNEVEKVETNQTNLTTFFKDTDNIQLLKEMIEDYKNKRENFIILDKGMIAFPQEVLQMKSNGTIGIKSNMEQYEKIKKVAFDNKVSMSTLVNYIFYDFLQKLK